MAKALLSDSESSDSEVGGADIGTDFAVNQEYAKRFEHNKKREELQKLEEKHGKTRKRKREADDDDSASDSPSSSSEEEDEEGEFATAALDDEIQATLNAIRSKDPRVYDAKATFYAKFDENAPPQQREKKDKPMYLRDYHRQNLLNGVEPDEAEEEPLSYNQQQEQLKKSVIQDFHAAAEESDDEGGDDDDDGEGEGGLLVRKTKDDRAANSSIKPDVENADRDPETFLSNFMAARAWVPTERAELHPFESDDEEEERRAEEFEEAYNMRFEDPEKSNEKLQSYARDVAAKYSVRREEKNSRQKKREAEKAAKEAAKQERREEKARLKKLRMEEVEEKVKRIKRAAGLKTSSLQPDDWAHFIDDDWDDSKWEEEMQRRFGDQYYAEKEDFSEASEEEEDDEGGKKKKRRKPKKPKFDDDIDIRDIVPDFQDDEDEAANFSLSDDEALAPKKKSKKQERIERQKDSKKERRIIEQLVEDQMQMELDHALSASSRAKSAGFRYRETSPQSFGLTSRDILLADDSALNQFAGLKKLATWREEEKKRKDKKHLGKKARLRKWRLETFGDEEGLEGKELSYGNLADGAAAQEDSDDEAGGVNIREGGKKKKGRRRKKAKTANGEAVTA